MVLRVLELGKPYSDDRSGWPETSELTLTKPTTLAMFMFDPTPAEIEATFYGTARFAWSELSMQGVLTFSFDPGIPWSTANFTPHRTFDGNVAGNNLIETPPRMHHRVIVVLVDANTGIIKALRITTWEAKFAEAVRRSVQKLAGAPFTEDRANAELAAFYDRYPGTQGNKLIVSRTAIATCKGGVAVADN